MLKTHFDQIEGELLNISRRPASTGHSLHKGTPREAFIKTYLEKHLSTLLVIGSGEIIDANSRPGAERPQIDIVVYKRHYPKLDIGGEIYAFLAESVVATIEVKSSITKQELEKSMQAAQKLKQLCRDSASTWVVGPGYKPPGIISLVVAYDGPKTMETVARWIPDINARLGISYPELGTTLKERNRVVAPAVDGIYVLGRGSVTFDALPIGFVSDEVRAAHPQLKWVAVNLERGSLLLLFLTLTTAANGVVVHGFNPFPYLSHVTIQAEALKLFE